MIFRGSVFSQALDMETGLTVIAPDTFDRDRPLRSAYLLHGLCGNHGNWSDYTQVPLYARDYDVVFVMPEAARSFYVDMKYGQKFFTYVSEELPELCAGLFRLSRKPEDTAVIGASMGGYGALKCALARPERFGWCGAFASACLYAAEQMRGTRSAATLAAAAERYGGQLVVDFQAAFGEACEIPPRDDIQALARAAAGATATPRFYLACGTDDELRGENARFAADMQNMDFDVAYEEWQGDHDWIFFNAALKKALAFCFD